MDLTNRRIFNYYKFNQFPYQKSVNNFFTLLMLFLTAAVSAQHPVLPATNLGTSNVFDGFAGKPGFVYQGYAQLFQTRKLTGDHGQNLHSDLKINSLVQLNQFIYLTPLKVFGGNLSFTVLVPVVQLSASNSTGSSPSVNPGALGDITQGTAVQWSGKKLFGKPFSHRAELAVTFPLGSYDENYAINASARIYTFSTYHTFTLMFSDKFSISSRNQFNYNTRILGELAKPGAFYNGNYSADYAIVPGLRVAAVGYFLAQLNQDTYDGNSNYYQEQGISDTREKVFGYGAGVAYFAKSGTLIELKTFFETASKNRAEGFRPTLRILVPLNL